MDIEKEAEKLVMKKTESKKTGMGDKGKNLDPKLCPEREEKFVGFKNEDETEMAELRREFIEIRMNIQESSIKRKSKTVDPKLEAKAKQFDKMIEECKPKLGIKRIVSVSGLLAMGLSNKHVRTTYTPKSEAVKLKENTFSSLPRFTKGTTSLFCRIPNSR